MIKDPCGACSGAGKKKKKVDLQVKIPAGIDQGQRLKLSHEGDAGTQGGPNGDLYVVINIKPQLKFLSAMNLMFTVWCLLVFPRRHLERKWKCPLLAESSA